MTGEPYTDEDRLAAQRGQVTNPLPDEPTEEWPECEEHEEVQHRDRKPPWCNACGWNRGRPALPARKFGTPRSEPKYSPGGVVGGLNLPSALMTLDDEECVLDRRGQCQRHDQPHLEIAHVKRGDSPPRPWEALYKDQVWESMSAEDQRDELLAAVGLLLEFINAYAPLSRYPMMPHVVEEMGRRYGPWAR